MNRNGCPIRVLYSFPHKLGADRICYTAWQQVNGLAMAGADLLVFPGVLHRAVTSSVRVSPTLARGKFRIPYKLLGSMRSFALHDHIVAKRLEKLAGQIDIVHTWPLGSLETLKTAAKLGITTVLERPNAHTRFAMAAVEGECKRLGVALPPDHEHAYNADKLAKENNEYNLADYLLCPSDFVRSTFLDEDFPPEKLLRHQYGFDDSLYHPGRTEDAAKRPFTMLFAGGCAPRKGLHYALEAWLGSAAHNEGRFFIAGQFIAGYAERLGSMLTHPSIQVLGHRKDIPELMRKSDILILPSVEEGSALVTSEARGSGCVVLVSEAAGAICKHMKTGLVHRVGDVEALTLHIDMLYKDRALLRRLRETSLATAPDLTWTAAGQTLLSVYKAALVTAPDKRIEVLS